MYIELWKFDPKKWGNPVMKTEMFNIKSLDYVKIVWMKLDEGCYICGLILVHTAHLNISAAPWRLWKRDSFLTNAVQTCYLNAVCTCAWAASSCKRELEP